MFSRTHGPKKRLFAHKSYPGAVPKTCPLNGDHRYLSFMFCTPDSPGVRKISSKGLDLVDFSRLCCSNERNSSRLGSNGGQKAASENLKNELRLLRGVPTDIKKRKDDPLNKKKKREVSWCGPPPQVIRRRGNLLRYFGWPN